MIDPFKLLSKLVFPNDENEILIRRFKSERIIRLKDNNEVLQRFTAALMIQSAFRGWNIRKKYLAVKYFNLSFNSIKGSTGIINMDHSMINFTTQEKLLVKYHNYSLIYEKLYDILPEFPFFAAVYIQSYWRMSCTRGIYRKFKKLEGLAKKNKMSKFTSRLSKYGSFLGNTREAMVKSNLNFWDKSAIIIQKAWRSYNGRRIFLFYKSLLSIWQSNNSARLLKFINPQESKLMESAAGLHIKFRLGGKNFPPTVFYKIFVHNPLIDMNAFSPRDYTKESKQILPVDLFNNTKTLANQKTDGWYSRMENNPWRPVSDRIWDAKQDYNPFLPSKKPVLFHHSQLVRRQVLEKKKRAKRINWMKKIYMQEKAISKALVPIAEIDEEMEPEIETDGLIKWTQALDFEKYFDDWTQLATSGPNQHDNAKRSNCYDFETDVEKATERSYTPQTQLSLSELMIK